MFEDRPLPFQVWYFVHKEIGTLSITRQEKGESNQITFDLMLRANPQWFFDTQRKQRANTSLHDDYVVQPVMRGDVTLSVSDGDQDTPSAVGYGTINFGALNGLKAIYPVHKFLAWTGVEIGVTNFTVLSFVNDYLRQSCIKCGMHPVRGGLAGVCENVFARSREEALVAGWE